MPNALYGGNTFSPYRNSFASPYRPTSGYVPPVTNPVTPLTTQQAPIMQSVQSMMPQSNIIWIDDPSQISSFPTGNGWQQWFGLKNEQIMYVRETDMNGITQPPRKVAYYLVEDNQTEAKPSEPAKVPTDNLVTKDEFNKLVESVNAMTEKLADLLK